MNEVLLRPIFRAKYIEEQKKNKFNKGGLASIQNLLKVDYLKVKEQLLL
jgi:hypothetical protein